MGPSVGRPLKRVEEPRLLGGVPVGPHVHAFRPDVHVDAGVVPVEEPPERLRRQHLAHRLCGSGDLFPVGFPGGATTVVILTLTRAVGGV